MKKEAFKQKIKEGFKTIELELVRQIKLIPYYLLLAILLVFALKTVPDYLITHVKPENLNNNEAITYFCTIIASFITIIGIFLTLNHNQKMVKDQLKQGEDNFKEERRFSVLPIIAISEIKTGFQNSNVVSSTLYNHLGVAFEYGEGITDNDIIDAGSKINKWDENNTDEIVFTFTDKKIIERQQLTVEQKEMIDLLPIKLTGYEPNTPYVHMPYTLTNTGLGAVINLFIFIDILIVDDDKAENKNLHITGAKNLKPGQELRLSFFAEECEYLDKNFTLILRYNDIFGNAYEQKHIIKYFDDYKRFILETSINQKITKKVDI